VRAVHPADLNRIVDTDRYPIADLADPRTGNVTAEGRRSLRDQGVAILDGFIRPEALDTVAADATLAKPAAHLQDAWGTAYLGPPDASFPVGHPRRTPQHSRTFVLAYDLVPATDPLRRLYEWDGLTAFLAELLERRPLYRMADPLGALNLTVMEEGHVQGWHYDSTDFVVSIAVQSSDAGGEFECVRDIRDADNEHYDRVARVLSGDAPADVRVHPMTPGTLMVFMGRYSLHRVAPVHGARPRIVGLFGYDTWPDTNSSDTLKRARYGRTVPVDDDHSGSGA
jgi:hypothetical protein